MYWSRQNPFNPSVWNQLTQLQQEMNRLVEGWPGRGRNGQTSPGFPACNVWEEGETVHVEAELPGFELNDLELFVTGNNELTIQGQRKPQAPEKAVQHRRERKFGNFTRTMTLPVPVDADKVEARLEHGVLRIELGKQEQARPRKIAVKG